MNAPPYVFLPGSDTYPPPTTQKGCDARVYILDADRKVLQETIDQWLNVPFNDVFDYVVLPWVAMFTMPIQQVFCPDAKDGSPWAGVAAETDVSFAVMLAAVRKLQPMPVVDHFAIAFPFIVVDNPISLVTGREVWGWRKAHGTFQTLPGTTMPISASTPVMTEFSCSCALESKEIMRMGGLIDDLALAPGDTVRGVLDHLAALVLEEGESFLQRVEGKLLGAAAKWILRHSLDARLLLMELIKVMQKHKRLNCAFLLQQRDCAAVGCASYQAVIEARMDFYEIESVLPLSRTTIILSNYPSYPIVGNLGIFCDADYNVKPLMALEAKFSFDMQDGRVIAEAGRVMMGATGLPF